MLEITRENIFSIKKTITLKNILGETFFILDSETGKQYNLTEMEYEIISSISDGMTLGEIIDSLDKEYDVTVCQIEIDLKEYVTSLIEEGLIFT